MNDELRQARASARKARLAAVRAAAEAATARRQNDHEYDSQQQSLAVSYQAMYHAHRKRESVLATTMADRAGWEQATRQQRHLAIAADAQLRRRHPGQPWPPLRSAEPEPTPQNHPVTAGATMDEIAQQATDLAVRHRAFAAQLAERQRQPPPAEGDDFRELGPSYLAWAEPGRDAILQPPKPQIQPSGQIMKRVDDRGLNIEPAD